MAEKKRVAIVGSGNWGSAIARIVGWNVREKEGFEHQVKMWVYEEIVDGKKLTEIINEQHRNTKYLPDFELPDNVLACSNIAVATKDADILVFVFPHQFIRSVCGKLKSHIKPGAFGVSLIKGIDSEGGRLKLISEVIRGILNIDVSVLMGANLAMDVARQEFCEATIGATDPEHGRLLRLIFNRPQFHVSIVSDIPTVELCGALKNIVAVGAGFVDGLNSKAAVIRIGLLEMWRFVNLFYKGCQHTTLLESCGAADLIATCLGGKSRIIAEAFVLTGRPIEELEAEMLHGQKAPGPITAKDVHEVLVSEGKVEQFPLMTAVYRILYENEPHENLIKILMELSV